VLRKKAVGGAVKSGTWVPRRCPPLFRPSTSFSSTSGILRVIRSSSAWLVFACVGAGAEVVGLALGEICGFGGGLSPFFISPWTDLLFPLFRRGRGDFTGVNHFFTHLSSQAVYARAGSSFCGGFFGVRVGLLDVFVVERMNLRCFFFPPFEGASGGAPLPFGGGEYCPSGLL